MAEQSKPRYPDIEIYLCDTPPQSVLNWLRQRFTSVTPEQLRSGPDRIQRLRVESAGDLIKVRIIPRVPGGFTSVCFDSSRTPWQTDRECALEAFAHFQVEVRCCADSWRPGQDPDEWLRISADGEALITWPD